MESHEDLMKRGTLMNWDCVNDGKYMFISHMWLGKYHPDPNGDKFRLLQDFLRLIRAGQADVQPHWTRELLGDSSPMTGAALHRDFGGPSGAVWLDYWSVPQHRLANREGAMRSVPSYVMSSSLLVCLTPPLSSSSGTIRDLRAWGRRGWCRFEELANVLSVEPKQHVAIESRSSIFVPVVASYLHRPVGLGQFAQQEDLEVLARLIVEMVDVRQAKASYMKDYTLCRFLEANRTNLLAGTTLQSDFVFGGRLHEWLTSMMFTSRNDGDASGWTPLRFAAYANEVDIAQELLEQRVDPNAPLPKERLDLGHTRGFTIIHGVCAARDSYEMLRRLMEYRADPALADESGFTALAYAAVGGFCRNVDAIMECRPQTAHIVDSRGGCTPWSIAAMHGQRHMLMHFHSRYAKAVAANPRFDAWGTNACAVAVTHAGDVETLEALIGLGHNIHQAQCPATLLTRAMTRVAEAACFARSRPGELMEFVANAHGSTPLLMAAYLGNAQAVHVLLNAAAEVEARNAYGRTALVLAGMRGHEEVAKLLMAASADAAPVDCWGRNAARWAQHRGWTVLAAALREYAGYHAHLLAGPPAFAPLAPLAACCAEGSLLAERSTREMVRDDSLPPEWLPDGSSPEVWLHV